MTLPVCALCQQEGQLGDEIDRQAQRAVSAVACANRFWTRLPHSLLFLALHTSCHGLPLPVSNPVHTPQRRDLGKKYCYTGQPCSRMSQPCSQSIVLSHCDLPLPLYSTLARRTMQYTHTFVYTRLKMNISLV
eukprot:m.133021 g.133021  ORF g.133021 m.133021 type:complete len:133 (+) comp17522_c0_seq2:120-518(+)